MAAAAVDEDPGGARRAAVGLLLGGGRRDNTKDQMGLNATLRLNEPNLVDFRIMFKHKLRLIVGP